jgi:hypothetical protein
MMELEAQEFDPCFYAVFPLALRGDNSVLQWFIAAGALSRTRTAFLKNSSERVKVFGPGITHHCFTFIALPSNSFAAEAV